MKGTRRSVKRRQASHLLDVSGDLERNHGRSGSVQTSGTMEHAEDAYARMMSGKAQFRVVLTM